MTIFDAIIQGIVQGLTEFLPVSSSGHLALVQYFTGQSGETGAFFSILLHAGTLVAVITAFWRTILELIIEGFYLLIDIVTLKFSFRRISNPQRMILLLLVSVLPLFGFVFLKDFYEGLATDNSIIAEGLCFLITATLLFFADRCTYGRKNVSTMKTRDALIIGIVQGIAPLPGVSRSGSTISTGLFLGLDKKFAVEFSFIMGIPAVLGAVLLEIKDIVDVGLPLDISTSIMAVGLITSVIFGLMAIKAVGWLVKNNKFKYFAIYTAILGTLTLMVGFYDYFNANAIQLLIMGFLK